MRIQPEPQSGRKAGKTLFWNRLLPAVAAVSTLIGWGPLGVTMLAAAITRWNGCRLDEGDAYPCILAGHDYGPLFYAMGEMFWLELLVPPAGILAILLWIALAIRWLVRKKRAGA